MALSNIDIAIFVAYAILIVALGLWVSRTKEGRQKTTKDYFLAGNALPWWAIGSSLIAANISAEQFVAMSGSGFNIGLGIATYEWMGAITLILIGIFLLPIYLKKKIYTMPQFLEERFDSKVRIMFAVFWIFLYIFVNLTSVLYLGALSLNSIMGVDMVYGLIGLAFVAVLYSLSGGLSAVAWTDAVQVGFLVIGGLVTTYFAVTALPGTDGFIDGMGALIAQVPEKFDMILDKNHEHYNSLPGLSVLLGGMWIMNISYWGMNQYITQRTFAAKNLKEAQRGILFAGFLKIIIPLIVVVPGIAAFALHADIAKADEAYPYVLSNFVPDGVKGLSFAALAAAIVSSLGSMMNSTSTIFTLDIYKRLLYKDASDKQMLRIARLTSLTAIIIAIFMGYFMIGKLDEAFQFIQNKTGYVTPAVVAIFLLGLFWKRTTANAAFWSAIITIPISALLEYGLPASWPVIPFMDRMAIVFIIIVIIAVVISLNESKKDHPKAIHIGKDLFKFDPVFIIGSIVVCIIIGYLYIVFW